MPGSIKCVKPFFLLLLLIGALRVNGQRIPVSNSLKSVVGALNTFRDKMPVEKLYVQLDKPYYNSGDTLHFKAYLLNADFLTPSVRSGLLYVELDDADGKMMKRVMVPLASGVSWGDIALVADDIPEGSYTFRAYTSWMLNFGEDYVFKKNIYISAVNGSATLINTNFKLADKGDKTNIRAGLSFTGLNGQALGLREMGLRVMNGRRTLFRDRTATNIDGTLDINFDLTDKAVLKNLAIQAQYRGKGADTTTLTIPVTINRPENTDVQFMPEGGNLVAGVSSKVGFKAISEDGKGINISGKVLNTKQQEVAGFQSQHKGMGSFEFTPEANETYTAKITLGDITKSYPLPVIHPSGTTLKVNNKGTDSLVITTTITPDLLTATAPATYYLIGQARGVVCYAARLDLKNSPSITHIAKNVFPTGIARFTLLTNTNIPLNERIVYIEHDDNLQISITPDKAGYGLRDSIALNLTVKDKDGKPVQGTFSLAISDNDQVKPDSTGSNILNSFLFTSDLKGTVEEPGWYLESNSSERVMALDNLLLTQGWVGYDWKNIFNPVVPEPKYKAEKEFVVEGKLTNVFNAPLKQTKVNLVQKRPLVVRDTVTDNNGRFSFKDLLPIDSSLYYIQVKGKNGENKGFNVGIDVDEFNPPQLSLPKQALLPWYINSDTTLLNNKHTKIAELNAGANYRGEGHLLKEVVIKSQKIIPNSYNLNGPGGADFTVNEADINKEKRSLSLFDLLKRKFPDFHKQMHFGRYSYSFDYHGNYLVDLVIDGVLLSKYMLDKSVYMEGGLEAADVKGIEVMVKGANVFSYYYIWATSQPGIPPKYDPGMTFLEITTYSGHGAFLKKSGGRYMYKPIPFSFPTEFYRPKYTDKSRNIAMGTDLRSTIHWEPNMVTDTTGKAIVSFFSADKPAAYTIIMEGTDLNGNIGYRRQKIKVAAKTIITK